MIEVRVSGKAYFAALDPRASNVPGEQGWPEPEQRKVGRGSQMLYRLTPDQAVSMERHLWGLGDDFVLMPDQDSRDEGRACLKAAEALREAIAAHRASGEVGE